MNPERAIHKREPARIPKKPMAPHATTMIYARNRILASPDLAMEAMTSHAALRINATKLAPAIQPRECARIPIKQTALLAMMKTNAPNPTFVKLAFAPGKCLIPA
jgi:hypothetical protein